MSSTNTAIAELKRIVIGEQARDLLPNDESECFGGLHSTGVSCKDTTRSVITYCFGWGEYLVV